MHKKRIFLAINLPQAIKEAISQQKKEIESLFPEEVRPGLLRWTKKDNIHITVLFLGNLTEAEITKLELITKEAVNKKDLFSLQLKGLDYGPPGKIPPRMIWLQLEPNQQLADMVQAIKRKSLQTGLLKYDDKRPFSPHITLARIKTWQWKKIEPEERPMIKRKLDQQLTVESIDIMESRLKRTGAEYDILKSLRLS